MFKTLSLLIATLTLAFASIACNFGINTIRGSGTILIEERSVSGFDSIAVGGAMQLYLTQGEEETLKIETDDNLLPYILSEIKNNELVIEFDQRSSIRNYSPSQRIKVYLTVINLETAKISGASHLFVEDALTAENLNVYLSGASQALFTDLQIVDRLALNMSGASQADITGQARELRLLTSGASNVFASDFELATADIEASGASNATIWVTELLTVNANGGSQIYYKGRPEIRQNTSGGSSVSPLR